MAGGGYPAAYRPASRPLARPTGPLSSPGGMAPRVPGTFPGLNPANTNIPIPSAIGRALPIAGRLLPLIGYGLLLYELWKLWNDFQAFQKAIGLASGWQRTRTHCGGREDGFGAGAQTDGACPTYLSQPGNTCGTLQSSVLVTPTTHSQVTSYECLGQNSGSPTRINYRPSFGYQRLSGSEPWRNPNDISPGILPVPDALPLPAIIPQVLPEGAPAPGTPVPDPVPMPHAFAPYMPAYSPVGDPIRGPVRTSPRPSRSPYRRRRRGPIYIPFPDVEVIGDSPDELPDPFPGDPRPAPSDPVPGPWPAPGAGPMPDLIPGTRVRFQPDEQPMPERHRHRLAPPPGRTKERKVILTLNGRTAFARGINAATEYCDFVDALFDALPWQKRALYDANAFDPRLAKENWSKYSKAQKRSIMQEHNRVKKQREAREAERPWWWSVRDKQADPQAVACQNKAAAVYDHFGELDMSKAFRNLVAMEAIDFVIGRLGKAAGEVGRAIGAPVGLGTGPAL